MAVVLMTGANGLIGRWVANLWDGSAQLVPVTSSDHDLLYPGAFINLLDRVTPDVVLHLAWSAGGRADYRESAENAMWVAISAQAAANCRQKGTRFIGAGTVLDDREPADAYSRSKRDLRESLAPWIEDGSTTWLRPFYVVDQDAGRPRVLGAARAAAAAGEMLELRDPDASHDFVHVADVASAIVAVVRSGLTGVIDIGSGRLRSVADLVMAAGYPWREGDATNSVLHDDRAADNTALRAAGWTPLETDRFFSR